LEARRGRERRYFLSLSLSLSLSLYLLNAAEDRGWRIVEVACHLDVELLGRWNYAL
jgi:hypothetical protein